MDRKYCDLCKRVEAVVEGTGLAGEKISVCNDCLKKSGRYIFARETKSN